MEHKLASEIFYQTTLHLPESVSDSDMLNLKVGSSSVSDKLLVIRDLPWRGENRYSSLRSSWNPYSSATFLFLSFSFFVENSPFPPEPEKFRQNIIKGKQFKNCMMKLYNNDYCLEFSGSPFLYWFPLFFKAFLSP